MSRPVHDGPGGMSRRAILRALGVVGGGFVVGVPLTAWAAAAAPPPTDRGSFVPNAFLQITPGNQIHFYQPRSEMGQGVIVGLTTLIAEELEVAPEAIIVHHAPVHPAFRRPGASVQDTAGSESMRASYEQMRQLGANAREAIRQAAAFELGVAAEALVLREGYVHLGVQQWPYGHFAEAAARRPVPTDARLKAPSDCKLIGRDRPRLDALAKSTGTAQFGIDVDFPGLYRAALKRCPVAGGTVKSVRLDEVAAMPGVHKVVTIFNGVAVVAQTYWQARHAVEKLDVEWNLPSLAQISSPDLRERLEQALEMEPGTEVYTSGDGAAALSGASRVVEATYWAPYLAHCTMEPMNCTVRIADGGCEVWVGCQMPESARGVAAHFSGVPRERVTVHSTFLGGGFGRRLTSDYVAEATAIARASGVPVQLLWSREDDVRHDRYRPASLVCFRAGLDAEGRVQTWVAKGVGPNIVPYFIDDVAESVLPEFLPWGFGDWASKRGYWLFDSLLIDSRSVQGLFGNYAFPHQEVRHVTVDPGLPLGYWRSVGHSCNAFFAECFMDELAEAARQDPVQFRISHNAHDPRMRRVIHLAAEKAGWGRPPAGRFLGFAAHNSFESAVAQVVEISMEAGSLKVHKVTCAIDCGIAVNPDIVRSQMEGGIIFGLTAALYGEITLKDGAVEQSNFHDYSMLRIDESPQIEVHIVPSAEPPSGVGEPGVPPLAPALANAVRAATGRRFRSLPLRLT